MSNGYKKATKKLLNEANPLLEISESSKKAASEKEVTVKKQLVKPLKRVTKKLIKENYYAADMKRKSVADKLTKPLTDKYYK